MLRIIVHILFAMSHLAGRPIVVHPFSAVRGHVLHAFSHGSCGGVEVIPTSVAVILTLNHMAIVIIPNPFVPRRNIDIFIHRKGSILIEPIPSITCWVIHLFRDRLHTIVIPVALPVLRDLTICSRPICSITCTNPCIPNNIFCNRIRHGYHSSVPIRNATSINISCSDSTRTMPTAIQV